MTAPRNVESYPKALLDWVNGYESRTEPMEKLTFPDVHQAHAFKREVYGLRKAMKRESGLEALTRLSAARIYVRQLDGEGEVAVVSADSLPYARSLEGTISGGHES